MTTHIMIDHMRYVPPLASQFATGTYGTNSENPTKTDRTGSGLVMNFGSSPATGWNVRAFTKAKASAANHDIIVRLRPSGLVFDHIFWGLCATDGTKFVAYGFGNTASNDGPGLRLATFATATSTPTSIFDNAPIMPHNSWLRVGVVSGAFKDFYISENGTDWIKVIVSDQTAFLTMTEVGIVQVVNRNVGTPPASGTNNASMSVLYYSDPDIVPAV